MTILIAGRAAVADEPLYLTYADDGTPQYSDRFPGPHAIRIASNLEVQPVARNQIGNAHPNEMALRFLPIIRQTARRHGVDAALIAALVEVESGFRPNAQSARGARGLMQLVPATASRYGVTDPFDAQQNLEAGTRHLKALLARHQGCLPLALAAYNAGQASTERQRIPPYAETLRYVPEVLARQQAYQALFAQADE